MTPDQVRQLIVVQCRKAGSQIAFAKRIGVSAPYLNDILRGKREPAATICDALGIERVVSYRKVKPDGEDR